MKNEEMKGGKAEKGMGRGVGMTGLMHLMTDNHV